MRLPNELQNKDQEYCIKKCDSNAISCPYPNILKRDINSNFVCKAGFIKYNFECIPESISNESKLIF